MAKPENNDRNQLVALVAAVLETKGDEVHIHPAFVATEVLKKIDPENYAQRQLPLVYFGCHLELRQIARGLLRAKFDPTADTADPDQHPLFPELQRRYPLPHVKGEGPTYCLLEHLPPLAVAFNVARLRAEARAKGKHAQHLEAWGWRTYGRHEEQESA